MNGAGFPMNLSTMSSRLGRASALFVLAFAAGHVHAADIAAGKAKAEAVCAACHGKDGNTPIDPTYPRLAGQHRGFIERALLDYKSGSRKNAIMAGQAQGLSRAEIDNLAAYYSSLPGSLHAKR